MFSASNMLLVVIISGSSLNLCKVMVGILAFVPSQFSATPPSSSTPLNLISCSDGVLVLGRERNVNMVFSVSCLISADTVVKVNYIILYYLRVIFDLLVTHLTLISCLFF